jgi:hypothetical protein
MLKSRFSGQGKDADARVTVDVVILQMIAVMAGLGQVLY